MTRYFVSLAVSTLVLLAIAALLIFSIGGPYIAQWVASEGQRILLEGGDTAEAKAKFESALDFDKRCREGILGLASVYLENEEPNRALETLKEGITLLPGNSDLYVQVLQIYGRLGRVQEAIEFRRTIDREFVLSALQEVSPAAVVHNPRQGIYNKRITVTLSSGEGSRIYYTRDGSAPTLESYLYAGPIQLTEGVNVIRAFAINEAGLVTDELRLEYELKDINEAVNIADEKLEKILRRMINKSSGTIYTSDLSMITQFSNLAEDGTPLEGYIYDLSALKSCRNLEQITLVGEPYIRDYSPLAAVSALHTLKINGCSLTDVDLAGISASASLRKLDLSDNCLNTAAAAGQMAALKELDLSENMISSLSALAPLSELEVLRVNRAGLIDISDLGGLSALQELYLVDNYLSSVHALSQLKSVKKLDLSDNRLFDIDGLMGMTSLKELCLADNQIADATALIPLRQLEKVDLSRNLLQSVPQLTSPVQSLSLSFNIIQSLKGVELVPTLKQLDLSGNPVTDLSLLTSLSLLEELDVSQTQVLSVMPLTGLNSLKRLICREMTISDLGQLSQQVEIVIR